MSRFIREYGDPGDYDTERRYPLNLRMWAAATALLTGKSSAEACVAAEIEPKTLQNYFRDPNFQAFMRQGRQDAFLTARCRLMAAAETAVGVLHDLMECGKESTRFNAACKILDLSITLKEDDRVEGHIERLEGMLRELEGEAEATVEAGPGE